MFNTVILSGAHQSTIPLENDARATPGNSSIYHSELYKDWNDTSIRPAVWLGEAKLMAAGGSHVWQKHASVVVFYR